MAMTPVVETTMTKLQRQKKRKPDPRGNGITVSAYLDPATYQKLVAAAGTHDRSVAKIIAICVAAHLPKL